jgi:hypothetical protein
MVDTAPASRYLFVMKIWIAITLLSAVLFIILIISGLLLAPQIIGDFDPHNYQLGGSQ